ncbi:MAG: TIGR04282 family arsenosugar biosynthesis glycosyltransferase [Acetobacteraceae bacterium]
MAKTPRPGQVKTRLVPPLSAEEATALNAAFLRDMTTTIATIGHALPVVSFVAYAPAGGEAAFDGLLAPGTALVLADGSVPLPAGIVGIGRSLLHATRTLLGRGFAAVCLVNSDSPNLPGAILREAVTTLAAGRHVVLGPAEDGGYYLIGIPAALAGMADALFRDIPWSTPAVTATTLARAAEERIDVVCLPPWYDVDDWRSLRRLIRDLAANDDPTASPAPETAACATRLGLSRLFVNEP